MELRAEYADVAVAYADCGTYGALDDVCDRLDMKRLAGLHCYDVFGGAERLAGFFEEQPGTYVLTDFLVKSFLAPSLPSSDWTAIRSCATTTSATTPVWSGWRRALTTSWRRWPTRPPRSWVCR